MTAPAPPPPGPSGDPRRLSSRELSILARIEDDLAQDDPALARHLSRRRSPPGLHSPLPGRRLLVALLLILVVLSLATLLPSTLWWPVLPALTVLLVGPWMWRCARQTDHN